MDPCDETQPLDHGSSDVRGGDKFGVPVDGGSVQDGRRQCEHLVVELWHHW